MASLFDFDARVDHYAVMGNPIGHSKSPKIHSLFAQQTQQNIDYQAIQVDDGGFRQAVGNFFANNGKGLNITVPFKQQAYELSESLSERARLAKSVNTLIPRENGSIYGDNTDGIGLIRDLTQNHGIAVDDKSVLLIGAGGAARGVIPSLIENGISSLHIVNRTPQRAYDLRDEFASLINISASAFDTIEDGSFDVLINASASSLHGEAPPLPTTSIGSDSCCYDLMYAANDTPFLVWAKSLGVIHCFDGLGMLVEQAAESFYLWRNVRPQTSPVIKKIKDELMGNPS